jgi:hypothetical protein
VELHYQAATVNLFLRDPLAERSGDFAGDTAPHNRDIILGQIDRSNDDAVLSVDGSEKQQQPHRLETR